jgi:hypothetical protein
MPEEHFQCILLASPEGVRDIANGLVNVKIRDPSEITRCAEQAVSRKRVRFR